MFQSSLDDDALSRVGSVGVQLPVQVPGTMHAFHLPNFYVQNLLAQGQLEIAGQTIESTQLFSGTTRFILSNGGHIAGIVNPPDPKSWYLPRTTTLPSPTSGWLPQRTPESWWVDRAKWPAQHAGEMTDPPPMGSAAHPVIGPGPGTYVFT